MVAEGLSEEGPRAEAAAGGGSGQRVHRYRCPGAGRAGPPGLHSELGKTGSLRGIGLRGIPVAVLLREAGACRKL